eukprot:TRINITY_DN4431_c0_g1_i1.p1 TRINITY_DN4431_c0_g1~~TRINITY_DN4431_c0_g1_i1.p1  ORF type:complete len:542 (+),score=59.69 TRINITY_DN4431_c0_g1_i1:258-1883(+)
MEFSVVGSSQAKFVNKEKAFRKLFFANSKQIWSKTNRISFDLRRNSKTEAIRVGLRAIRSEISVTEKVVREKGVWKRSAKKLEDRVRLFVGLPLDAVSDCNSLNHAKAIAVGLKALKLLGVDGVEFPVWWGIAEKEFRGKYDWSAYLALAQMVRDAGLNLRVSLCFHASKSPAIPLPQWVSRIGETDPDIYFANRAGRRYKECLSLAVDDLPVLDGNSPMRVFEEFMESFKSSFSDFIGSTITDITVGLGPDGELRYPSSPFVKTSQIQGVGEFQCYDKHMLNNLRQHAQSTGNPNWGLSGPHDTPDYDQFPDSKPFFKEHGGSWESPYGNFFLSWYSTTLLSHADRLLSLASVTFRDSPVTLSGKIPLMHPWYRTRSHPGELTAGFYNTDVRDGYDAIAETFARNSCAMMVLPGMDLSDEHQLPGQQSSPDSLLLQIKRACEKHGVSVAGENSWVSGMPGVFGNIKNNVCGEKGVVESFTYQRMGAYFFSPENWPMFTAFVRELNQQEELHSDDMPGDEKISLSGGALDEEKDLQMMQVA